MNDAPSSRASRESREPRTEPTGKTDLTDGYERRFGPRITALRAAAYTIPAESPESDGTFSWNATTLVVAQIDAGGETGLGYTYSDACVASLMRDTLAPVLMHADPGDTGALWLRMQQRVRNLGRAGLAATAISALDCALWDLKAKLLHAPLAQVLGMARDAVPLYGSGGFTNYTDAHLAEQLGRWVAHDGCRAVKMKVGSDPARDPERVKHARAAIDSSAELFVDANGALSVQQALRAAEQFAPYGVTWFEEPVSSDDAAGLHAVRRRAPAGMDVAAGEYSYTADDSRRLLEARAVDVLQADVSRCGGVTGFMQAARLADAWHVPLSAHCAPALHLHVAAAVPGLRHQEWFHDHVRIESMLFDGAPTPRDGAIAPDLSRPGCGLAFRYADAQPFAVG
ncbi:enolase C-terminal domain-like protein [Paraburkholderia kururiensis]|uniref:Enolase C-terminal domain-like protein n=1 Tax=Paraburkholderia kururiensis TaxID=984307 RepID=A0ABZ0WT03_9BURK|nr:enolase C-terminal domain-like protein [Paraburkholderia kururiensis]WQD80514.1 enolase C-terminal domain-like protein [Paraburkholderia kururiensis]